MEDYIPTKKRKVLIVKKLSLLATELFLRGRKLNIALAFILQYNLKVPKTKRLNATHYFILDDLQQIASNHLSDIGF